MTGNSARVNFVVFGSAKGGGDVSETRDGIEMTFRKLSKRPRKNPIINNSNSNLSRDSLPGN